MLANEAPAGNSRLLPPFSNFYTHTYKYIGIHRTVYVLPGKVRHYVVDSASAAGKAALLATLMNISLRNILVIGVNQIEIARRKIE